MRVLVTGSSGFIGAAVCAELIEKGHQPVAFDHPKDVRDEKAVLQAVKDVDAVINLAGVLGTAETVGEEREACEVNTLGALNVMNACRFFGVPMVQIATGHEGQPNPYAITKKCVTDLALSRAEYLSQPISVVRAYHVYGPGQKMCAPHGKSKVRKIVPSFVARALTGMPIEINGDGMQKVDLVWVDDVAAVLVDAINGPYGRVIEAGTGVATTVIDAARTVIQVCGSNSKIVHKPMRVGEPEGAVVVAAEPKCPNAWPHKLADTIAYYREAVKRVA